MYVNVLTFTTIKNYFYTIFDDENDDNDVKKFVIYLVDVSVVEVEAKFLAQPWQLASLHPQVQSCLRLFLSNFKSRKKDLRQISY